MIKSIYIYKTEVFETHTIFHVIIIFKILALKNSDFNNYFSPILLLLPYKNPINSFSFPIFPSSPFFCVYFSFAFWLFLSSSVTGAQNQKKSIVLDFFFFSNKAVYQYGRHYPFPMKKLDMWPCFNHSFAFKFYKTFFHLIVFFIGHLNI